MSAPKLTPWYPMTTEPVREGVYKVKSHKGRQIRHARWQEGQWHTACGMFSHAVQALVRSKDCYDGCVTGWRGLAAQGCMP